MDREPICRGTWIMEKRSFTTRSNPNPKPNGNLKHMSRLTESVLRVGATQMPIQTPTVSLTVSLIVTLTPTVTVAVTVM